MFVSCFRFWLCFLTLINTCFLQVRLDYVATITGVCLCFRNLVCYLTLVNYRFLPVRFRFCHEHHRGVYLVFVSSCVKQLSLSAGRVSGVVTAISRACVQYCFWSWFCHLCWPTVRFCRCGFNFVSPQSSVCVLFYGFSSVVWAAFPQARFRCCHHYIWPLFVSYGLCAVMSPMKGIGRYCPNVECVWMFTRAPL